MATPAASTPNPSAPIIISAETLIQDALKRVPGLYQIKGQFELICRIYVQYLTTEPRMPMTEALEEISALMTLGEDKVTADVIKEAILAINKIVSAASISIAEDWERITGRSISTSLLEINPTIASERDEQKGNDKIARQYLGEIRKYIFDLGIKDLYQDEITDTAAKQAAISPTPVERGSIFSTWISRINTAVEGKQTEVVSETADVEPMTTDSAPNWLSVPILNESDETIKGALTKLNAISRLMKRYAGQERMKELVIGSLANLTMDVNKLEELFYKISKWANEQIAQSQEILKEVDEDAQVFADRIDAVNDVKEIYQAVLVYFFPQTTKSTTPEKKSK